MKTNPSSRRASRFACHLWAGAALSRFARAKRGAAALEFALVSIALLAFMIGILNLGTLGLTLGALQHGVQGAARAAAIAAAANLSGVNGTVSACPTGDVVRQDFNKFAAPALPLSTGLTTDGSPVLYASTGGTSRVLVTGGNDPWANNAAGLPSGSIIVLTATYKWKPVGFQTFGTGITLSLTAAASVLGTTGNGSSTCT